MPAHALNTNRPGLRIGLRLASVPPGVGPLTAAFGLFSLSYSAVTLPLAIYGFDVAGALGAGLAGADEIVAVMRHAGDAATAGACER